MQYDGKENTFNNDAYKENIIELPKDKDKEYKKNLK